MQPVIKKAKYTSFHRTAKYTWRRTLIAQFWVHDQTAGLVWHKDRVGQTRPLIPLSEITAFFRVYTLKTNDKMKM